MGTQPPDPILQNCSCPKFPRSSHTPGNARSPPWRQVKYLSRAKSAELRSQGAIPAFNIKDTGIASVLEALMARFGRGTHSSFFDASYSVYLLDNEQTAVCFKVSKNVAVMYGDPLCQEDKFDHVFEEFESFCEKQHWHLAVVAAGPTLVAYAKTKLWKRMEFAVEQVLNPMNNAILQGTAGKTIRRTNKKLVGHGIRIFLYEPIKGTQPQLEKDLMEVYSTWREERCSHRAIQAYTAVIDPFAMPGVTRYLYTRGSDDKPNSLDTCWNPAYNYHEPPNDLPAFW